MTHRPRYAARRMQRQTAVRMRVRACTSTVGEVIMTHHWQIRTGTLALAIATLAACGGERQSSTDSAAMKAAGTTNAPSATATPPAAPGATPPATPSTTPSAAPAPATGATHDVQMLGDASGYRFNPANITIKRGDAVRWTNVSGGPHNVSFWADSIPAGAQGPLSSNMPQQMMPLGGPLLTNPNQTYTISFANVPAGTYKYFCTPHLALGMKGVITVQ
jgi:plastocyanin